MENQTQTLQNNSLAAAIFSNDEGKILICKTPFSNGKFSLPTVKINDSMPIVKFIEMLFETEFAIDLNILDYYETLRVAYKEGESFKMGNYFCYDFVKVEPYKHQPILTPEPSGGYIENQYKTVDEIISLWNNNQLDDTSFYFILRRKDRDEENV